VRGSHDSASRGDASPGMLSRIDATRWTRAIRRATMSATASTRSGNLPGQPDAGSLSFASTAFPLQCGEVRLDDDAFWDSVVNNMTVASETAKSPSDRCIPRHGAVPPRRQSAKHVSVQRGEVFQEVRRSVLDQMANLVEKREIRSSRP